MLDIMRENAQSWIIKILFAIIILAFVLTFGISSFTDKGDPIFAYVNDAPITRQEYEVTLARFVENLRNNKNITAEMLDSPQLKEMVLSDMITKRLVLAEAERLGITVSNEELYKAISAMPAFWGPGNIFDKDRYAVVLRGSRTTPEQFEREFKQKLLQGKLQRFVAKTAKATPEQARSIYNWLREEARIKYLTVNPDDFMNVAVVTDDQVAKFYQDNVDRFQKPQTASFEYIAFTPEQLASQEQVSEEEMKAYYDNHKDSFKQDEQVSARHILIKLDKTASPAEVKKATEKIKGILAKARAGKDFGKLAEKYSEGPSAATGGDLGWFGRGAMVPAFEETAFALKKGEVSDPVRTEFGLHIIKVDDRKAARTLSFDKVKNSVKGMIAEDKASDRVSDLLDDSMDRLFSGMSLDEIAKELKLRTIKTPMVSAQQIQQAFGMTKEAAETLFSSVKGAKPKTPLSIKGGYMLAVKLDDDPSAPIPLEKVKATIAENLRAQEAAKLAETKANEILAGLNGDKAAETLAKYKKDIKKSKQFRRNTSIPALGQNPQLIAAVFAAKENTWLPSIYRVPAGFVIASRTELIPAPNDAWEQEKNAWIKTATERYEQEMFQSYLADLRQNATVEIVRKDLLN